jgi:hypothetical protein
MMASLSAGGFWIWNLRPWEGKISLKKNKEMWKLTEVKVKAEDRRPKGRRRDTALYLKANKDHANFSHFRKPLALAHVDSLQHTFRNITPNNVNNSLGLGRRYD